MLTYAFSFFFFSPETSCIIPTCLQYRRRDQILSQEYLGPRSKTFLNAHYLDGWNTDETWMLYAFHLSFLIQRHFNLDQQVYLPTWMELDLASIITL